MRTCARLLVQGLWLKERGLTLIELIVAVAITAIIGVISATFLSSMIANNSQVQGLEQQLASLERSLQIMRSDIEQIAIRPTIQGIYHNDTFVPDFDKSQIIGDQSSLEFSVFSTRPENQGLQHKLGRVRYRQEADQLIRESIDTDRPAANQKWQTMLLFDDVENINFEYFFNGWESSLAHNKKSPKAIRVTLDSQQYTDIELIVILSGVDQ